MSPTLRSCSSSRCRMAIFSYASNAGLVDVAKLITVFQKSVPTAAAPPPGGGVELTGRITSLSAMFFSRSRAADALSGRLFSVLFRQVPCKSRQLFATLFLIWAACEQKHQYLAAGIKVCPIIDERRPSICSGAENFDVPGHCQFEVGMPLPLFRSRCRNRRSSVE